MSNTRPPLSREAIVDAAIGLADEEGISAVSMRKVAKCLGYEVMSLYNHVANKSQMLDAMVDRVAAAIERPEPSDDWRSSIASCARSAHDVLMERPWAATLWSSRMPGPNRVAYMEAILHTLRESGLGASLTYHAYHAVTMHVVGFSLQETSFDTGEADLGDLARSFLESVGRESVPFLAEHVEQHLSGDESDEFGYVLDLILDGFEARRTS